jgi:hypothetical protein
MQGVARAVEAHWQAGDKAAEPPPTLGAAPVVAGGR